MGSPFWSAPVEEVLGRVEGRPEGLSRAEADRRRGAVRPLLRRTRGLGRLLARQLSNPLVLLLLAAGALSWVVGAPEDALTLLVIVGTSAGLGAWQEWRAERTLSRLLAEAAVTATVRRGGSTAEIPVSEVVPGDVVLLSVGATVPADARVLRSEGLQVDQAPLTGESFPARKDPCPCPEDAPLGTRWSAVFLGTHVVSGTGEVVAVDAGRSTELGRLSERLLDPRAPTEFDLGVRRFGDILLRLTLGLSAAVFVLHLAARRPPLESLLFSVALAVGLTPELLPAIVAVSLASGARRMARADVVVKRLAAVEDLGAVDVLCADKTGTLTEGRVRLRAALGVDGRESDRALRLAALNARFESGYANPVDSAIREACPRPEEGWTKAGEVAYDFARKRLSVLVERGGERLLITKGQWERVLEVCAEAELPDGSRAPLDQVREPCAALHERLASSGQRALGVAIRRLGPEEPADLAAERGMVLVGALALADAPRPEAAAVVRELADLGVRAMVLTGDDRRAARHLWRELTGREPALLTGADLDAALPGDDGARLGAVDVVAELEPRHKEAVVLALRRAGRVVAFLGDGINDAPALHAAHVGVTVDGAADVARESADVVLRRPGLGVLAEGIREGRRTLERSLVYLRYTTSANLGNMVSMAVASVTLPFLPMLPGQILLNNLLSDLPALAISTEPVDEELVRRPGRWRTRELLRFTWVFGSLSAAFDALTFLALLALTSGRPPQVRSGWFVESLLTEVWVLFVLRTRRPILRSPPGAGLAAAAAAVSVAAWALTATPLGGPFGLVPLAPSVLAAVLGLTVAYVGATGLALRRFFATDRAAGGGDPGGG